MQTIRAGGMPEFGRGGKAPLVEVTPDVLPLIAPAVGGERAAPKLNQQVTRKQLLEVLSESESRGRAEAVRRKGRARSN